MIKDLGDIKISEADEANIPLACQIHEPDFYHDSWRWEAINFLPRLGRCYGSYKLEGTQEEIIEAVTKYVVPLYEVAASNMKERHESYYWEKP